MYHDKTTGRAVIVIITLLNKALIEWTSQRQAIVETSTYGSEIVATSITVDQLLEWRYTLRMLRVLLSENGGSSYIFGDNKTFVDSTTIPDYKSTP